MSRVAQRSTAPAPKRPDDKDDICPVCKSSGYLNPNMRFLVNPECYHKMCESCVDRIFSHGPAQCPVAGCRKTLRKHRFRKQTFEDVQIEREVDIRRRVADVFNRREDEFETLHDYNDYLEKVEDLTFNLIHKIDLTNTERQLADYAAENARSIKQNASLAASNEANMQARQAAEKEQARIRRTAARREDEDARRERVQGREDIIDRLATASSSADAAKIAADGERVILKRTSARRAAADAALAGNTNGNALTSTVASGSLAMTGGGASTNGSAPQAPSSLAFSGLKKSAAAAAGASAGHTEKPYDPFGGLSFQTMYFVEQDRYAWDWLDEARNGVAYTAGGYNVREYCRRALVEAFQGLGIDVAKEMVLREAESGPLKLDVNAAAEANAGKKSNSETLLSPTSVPVRGRRDVDMNDVF